MNLVDYSDSEGSDDEIKPQATPASSNGTPAPGAKSRFQKVVDRSNPHKIRMSLPTAAAAQHSTNDNDDFADSDRPAKRTKIGSAFSGFNSFLPAPKNPAKSGIGSADGGKSALGSARSGGIGRGISLKTGAAPSFSRQSAAPSYGDNDGENDQTDTFENGASVVARPEVEDFKEEEVKLVGKTNMFKPLSVARKPAKKKVVPVPSAPTTSKVTAATVPSRDGETPAPQIIEQPKQPPPPPVKKSLFSSYNDETIPLEILQTETQDPIPETSTPGVNEQAQQSVPTNASSGNAAPTDLQSIADNLNLTASQRRQLFGRGGMPQDARVASFNLAAEYSENNRIIEQEGSAAPVAKVRGIAPGKHSLQQLVNAAANQKEALEESFATGRRNKKDAGGRYGW